MAWVAVDKDGKEWIFAYKPYRKDGNRSLYKLNDPSYWSDQYVSEYGNEDTRILLPKCPIPTKECMAILRSDLSYVIFKKLEKVGEPYEKRVSDGTFSTFQRYKVYNSVILPQKALYVLQFY